MIDFHTHILPNIDDGSRSIDETFNLIKEAEEAGFSDIILTPHYKLGRFETDVAEREAWVDAISKNLSIKNFKGNIYLGNEIYITENMIDLLSNEKASTINNTSYVLFELPFHDEPINMYDVIYELQKNKVVPVLAHPERYSYMQKEPELIYDLIEKGVLMQSNYESFIGQYGTKAQMIVRKMLENNSIHFLGSDVHRQNTIYKAIPQIVEELEELVGKEKLEEITTINPKLALSNKKIEIRTPIKIELNLKEKLRMNVNFKFLK